MFEDHYFGHPPPFLAGIVKESQHDTHFGDPSYFEMPSKGELLTIEAPA